MPRFKEVFAASPVLTMTAVLMAVDLLFCLFGLLVDRTVITGMPAWIKPTKFALSTGIYAASVAVIIRYTPIWRKTLRFVDLMTGIALILEIILIDLQAARHTTSHFNVATPFDRNVFIAMGTAIGVLWISAVVLAIAAFRTRYGAPSWTVAVRCGLLLAVLGTGSGAFMTSPSRAQLEAARTTNQLPISGSHTVGGPDGGPGLPLLGWSAEHGDLRVAHFFGLHALQVLALVALWLQRRGVPQVKATRIIYAAALSYAALFLIALAEALLKLPITNHGPVFTTVWALWAVLSLILFISSNAKNIAPSRGLSGGAAS